MSGLGNKDIMALNIKYYMEEKGIDRNTLCSDLDIKYTTLCDWLNAKTYPRIDKIELMANYFGVQKSDLVESRSENAEIHNFSAEEKISNKKAGIKFVKRDGTSQEFDINSIIYAVTESLMRMSPEEQKLVHKMVARDDKEDNKKKKNIVYISNPQYAKIRRESSNKRTPYEIAMKLKEYHGSVAFLEKFGGSLVTSILDVITLDDLETLNLSTENKKSLKKIIVNKGYDNFNNIEAKNFIADFVLAVAYKDIVFNDDYYSDIFNQCHYISSQLAPSQRTKLFNDSALLNASHERTDIEVTDEMKKHDEDLFDEE